LQLARKPVMRFLTPEKAELIQITKVETHPDGLMIHGKIMGTMPMKAILTGPELRKGFCFARPGIIWTVLKMLFRRTSTKTH
jgi:hypothetical protein